MLNRPLLIREDHLLELPEPVQRYMRYVHIIGKEPVRTVHFKQRGIYRTKPANKWLPFVAEQFVSINPAAFLWRMTSWPAPLFTVSVTDRFSNGRGNLSVKLWSLIPMSNARGPEMDVGELQRYLSELACYPTAWLSGSIRWQAIDENSAKATISQQGITASVVVHVDEQGHLTEVTAQRYMAEQVGYRLEPWSGQFDEYQEVNGMLIPTRMEATWHLASGEFTWFRSELTEIEYNQTGKVAALR